MKKILCLIIAILMLVLTVSCDNKNTINSIDESTAETTEEKSEPQIDGEMITVSMSSFEEYNNFIKITKLPDDFLYWDKLSQLGEFESLIFLSDAYCKKDYSDYLYNFVDETGTRISMYVYGDTSKHHFESYKTKYNVITEVNIQDIRNIDITDRSCVYYDENILYAYVGGELSSIIWNYEGKEYVLCMISGEGNLCDYPDIDTTLTGRLLNQEKSHDTLEEFLISINK